jgi:hypothetical protein
MNERWTYNHGFDRGFAAGFACAAVVAFGVVFCLLAFDTFNQPVQTTVKSDASKRPTGKP